MSCLRIVCLETIYSLSITMVILLTSDSLKCRLSGKLLDGIASLWYNRIWYISVDFSSFRDLYWICRLFACSCNETAICCSLTIVQTYGFGHSYGNGCETNIAVNTYNFTVNATYILVAANYKTFTVWSGCNYAALFSHYVSNWGNSIYLMISSIYVFGACFCVSPMSNQKFMNTIHFLI